MKETDFFLLTFSYVFKFDKSKLLENPCSGGDDGQKAP